MDGNKNALPMPDTDDALFGMVNYLSSRRQQVIPAQKSAKLSAATKKQREAKRRKQAKKRLTVLLLAYAAITAYIVIFATDWLLTSPIVGYIGCIVGAVSAFFAGFLAAEATR